MQIETIFTYSGHICFMGVPYKAKGYIETFNLALEKQRRTEHMNRTIVGGKKKGTDQIICNEIQ